MHSVVRQATGIDFEGAAYEGSFVLADIHLDWPLGRDEVSLFFSPAGLVVVAPLPDGSFRVVATMDEAPREADDCRHPGADRQPRSHRKRGQGARCDLEFALSSAPPHRQFLPPRAAAANGRRRARAQPGRRPRHEHWLVDAVVLGQILADVVKGKRPESALDLYETLRRPAALQVLELAGRMTGMATMRSPLKRFVRNAVMLLINLNPLAKRRHRHDPVRASAARAPGAGHAG